MEDYIECAYCGAPAHNILNNGMTACMIHEIEYEQYWFLMVDWKRTIRKARQSWLEPVA